jgi:hypothetical protein
MGRNLLLTHVTRVQMLFHRECLRGCQLPIEIQIEL